jgi:hypothetical protein
MQRFISSLVAIAWGLWFGGLGTVFLVVVSIFRTFGDDRRGAGRVASGVFHMFERYQLGLAAAALVLTFLWRVLRGAAGHKTALFVLFALATVLAVTSTVYVTPQIEQMRQQGVTTGDHFRRMHGTSSILYVSEAAVLLVAGFVMVWAIVQGVPTDPNWNKGPGFELARGGGRVAGGDRAAGTGNGAK